MRLVFAHSSIVLWPLGVLGVSGIVSPTPGLPKTTPNSIPQVNSLSGGLNLDDGETRNARSAMEIASAKNRSSSETTAIPLGHADDGASSSSKTKSAAASPASTSPTAPSGEKSGLSYGVDADARTYDPFWEPRLQDYFEPLRDYSGVARTDELYRGPTAAIPEYGRITWEEVVDQVIRGQPIVIRNNTDFWPFKEFSCRDIAEKWPTGDLRDEADHQSRVLLKDALFGSPSVGTVGRPPGSASGSAHQAGVKAQKHREEHWRMLDPSDEGLREDDVRAGSQKTGASGADKKNTQRPLFQIEKQHIAASSQVDVTSAPYVWHVKDEAPLEMKRDLQKYYRLPDWVTAAEARRDFNNSEVGAPATVGWDMLNWFELWMSPNTIGGSAVYAHADGYHHPAGSWQLRGKKKWRIMMYPQGDSLEHRFDSNDGGIYGVANRPSWEMGVTPEHKPLESPQDAAKDKNVNNVTGVGVGSASARTASVVKELAAAAATTVTRQARILAKMPARQPDQRMLWRPEYEFELEPGNIFLFQPGYMHETFVEPALEDRDSCALAATFLYFLPSPTRYIRTFLPRLLNSILQYEENMLPKTLMQYVFFQPNAPKPFPVLDAKVWAKQAEHVLAAADFNKDRRIEKTELTQWVLLKKPRPSIFRLIADRMVQTILPQLKQRNLDLLREERLKEAEMKSPGSTSEMNSKMSSSFNQGNKGVVKGQIAELVEAEAAKQALDGGPLIVDADEEADLQASAKKDDFEAKIQAAELAVKEADATKATSSEKTDVKTGAKFPEEQQLQRSRTLPVRIAHDADATRLRILNANIKEIIGWHDVDDDGVITASEIYRSVAQLHILAHRAMRQTVFLQTERATDPYAVPSWLVRKWHTQDNSIYGRYRKGISIPAVQPANPRTATLDASPKATGEQPDQSLNKNNNQHDEEEL
ncbi:unnamed protein product [Amoebophrya sp. A25]|nr:unnamed protein product [Amoebophrya sp. A25]|eukprot:GSA25T00014355001.1